MQWISINDQKPKDSVRVLLLVRDKPIKEGSFYICCGNRFDNENVPSEFQLDDDTVEDMLRDDRIITHWMPLPEPIL